MVGRMTDAEKAIQDAESAVAELNAESAFHDTHGSASRSQTFCEAQNTKRYSTHGPGEPCGNPVCATKDRFLEAAMERGAEALQNGRMLKQAMASNARLEHENANLKAQLEMAAVVEGLSSYNELNQAAEMSERISEILRKLI